MIEIIELILSGIERGVPLVTKLIADAEQSGELTADQAEALRARAKAAFASAEARTDDQTPVSEGGTMPDTTT